MVFKTIHSSLLAAVCLQRLGHGVLRGCEWNQSHAALYQLADGGDEYSGYASLRRRWTAFGRHRAGDQWPLSIWRAIWQPGLLDWCRDYHPKRQWSECHLYRGCDQLRGHSYQLRLFLRIANAVRLYLDQWRSRKFWRRCVLQQSIFGNQQLRDCQLPVRRFGFWERCGGIFRHLDQLPANGKLLRS